METKETILKKAIEKAVKNGWQPIELADNEVLDYFEMLTSSTAVFYKRKKYQRTKPKSVKAGELLTLSSYLFDHDFAKAFWGTEELGWWSGYNEWGKFNEEDLHEDSGLTPLRLKNWQYHLQQMVLEEDPIKYLSKFI